MPNNNTEITLEIGNGKYFDIIGNPEIDDQLSQHGETMTCNIVVDKDTRLPKPGYLGFLVRNNSEKLFGGLLMTAPIQIKPVKNLLSLQFGSYTLYTQRAQINNYRKTANLVGHVNLACQLANVIDVPLIARQLFNVFVIPDPNSDDPFLFEFPNGNLEQFLDKICSVANCRWVTQDTGALRIALLGTANANLIVQSNNVMTNFAPKQILRIPDDTSVINKNDVFWSPGLTYSYTPPVASVYLCVGHNGFNAVNNEYSSHNDLLQYRGEDGRTSYPILKTADKVLSIKVTT